MPLKSSPLTVTLPAVPTKVADLIRPDTPLSAVALPGFPNGVN